MDRRRRSPPSNRSGEGEALQMSPGSARSEEAAPASQSSVPGAALVVEEKGTEPVGAGVLEPHGKGDPEVNPFWSSKAKAEAVQSVVQARRIIKGSGKRL